MKYLLASLVFLLVLCFFLDLFLKKRHKNSKKDKSCNDEHLVSIALTTITPQQKKAYRAKFSGFWKRVQLAQDLGVSLRSVDRWLDSQS